MHEDIPFLWISWNYTFHIIALVPTFPESETDVDPGFVKIKFFFFIRYKFFYLYHLFWRPSNNVCPLNETSRLFMRLFHTKPISFNNPFKDVPIPSPVNFLLQNWNKFTHGGYGFTLNMEFLYSILLMHLLK